jgi:hypothetical protein
MAHICFGTKTNPLPKQAEMKQRPKSPHAKINAQAATLKANVMTQNPVMPIGELLLDLPIPVSRIAFPISQLCCTTNS